MAGYSVFFRNSVRKDVDRIPRKDVGKIIERLKALSKNPRPPGVEKLSAQERYRIRQGNYRIIYSIQDSEKTVWVVKIGQRQEVYRD